MLVGRRTYGPIAWAADTDCLHLIGGNTGLFWQAHRALLPPPTVAEVHTHPMDVLDNDNATNNEDDNEDGGAVLNPFCGEGIV